MICREGAFKVRQQLPQHGVHGIARFDGIDPVHRHLRGRCFAVRNRRGDDGVQDGDATPQDHELVADQAGHCAAVDGFFGTIDDGLHRGHSEAHVACRLMPIQQRERAVHELSCADDVGRRGCDQQIRSVDRRIL